MNRINIAVVASLAAGMAIGSALPVSWAATSGGSPSVAAMVGGTTGAQPDRPAQAASAPAVVVNITSGPNDLFAVTTGLRMAAEARSLGRRVIVLFNNAGVRVPMQSLPAELRLNNEPPLIQMLLDLRAAGAEFIVCDFSVRALGIHDAEFVADTFIAHTNEAVLHRMGTNAVVFTY